MRKDCEHVELNLFGHCFCLITIVPSPTVKVRVAPPLPARARTDRGVMLFRSRGCRSEKLLLISPKRRTSALMSALKPGIKSTFKFPEANFISEPRPCQLRAGIVKFIVPD